MGPAEKFLAPSCIGEGHSDARKTGTAAIRELTMDYARHESLHKALEVRRKKKVRSFLFDDGPARPLVDSLLSLAESVRRSL